MPRWCWSAIVAIPVVPICLCGTLGVVAWFGFDSARSRPTWLNDTPVATTSVVMLGNRFLPPVITVRSGDTIRWVNADTVAHNVLFRRGPESGYLRADEAYELSLTSGEYEYFCSLHAGMVGLVFVTELVR